ncbi:MAG: hypothetical protein KAK00_07725 [Nanoarchaeota archaeon]|nr:hypothetical protein [Nanoarchaeota archaeon]
MNDSKKNDMELKEIEEIGKMSQERFQSQKEHYEFLMYQLQSHMIEIDDRKTNGDLHYLNEIADIAILAHLLAKCEGVEDSVFKERYRRFKEKIEDNS